MKLCWFHLMPWTGLPADFAEKHPSVWVDVDPKLFDVRRGHRLYNDFLDELELAAELGFDGVCVNEHHSNAYGLMPSPNLMAAALARGTRDAALVVMGASLALYNPPIRVAEEFAMIDCISGGRLVAGFPVGTPMDTCYAYGQNPSMLRERYHEALDLVMRAWTEDEPFTFHGRFNQLRYVNVWPRPVQKPHPPIWIPGGGSVETWQWCAQRDYVYSYLSYFGYRAGARTMKGFWAEMDRLGKERLGERGLAKRLHRIRTPTLVLWGEADRLIPPSYATEFAGAIGARTEVRILPGAGHLLDLDAAEEAAAAIESFLDT
jgi:pimeloyl-ACP methyl ester carboxylesterase